MSEPNPFLKPEIAKQWKQTLDFEHSQEVPMSRIKVIYPYIFDWIRNNGVSGKILDLGSGEGYLGGKFPKEITYVGIEPSEPLVEMAKAEYKAPNISYLIGNAYATGLDDENADGIISVMVWFHLADLETSARELFRNLKLGGRFLIITANPDARVDWESYYENLKVDGKTLTGIVHTPGFPMTESITYMHTNEEMKSAFEDAGLVVEKIEPIGIPNEEGRQQFVAILGIKKI